MPRVKLTEELLREIQERVFGPCTIVYEAMTLEEIRRDIENYLKANRVYMRGEKKAIYKPGLTITNLKSWLLLRRDMEIYDVDPETPFDRTDAQIENAQRRRNELERVLDANINELVLKLRHENKHN
jgi:hypothetical protein